MSGRSIDRRLSALDRVGGGAMQTILVWCEHRQTKDEALTSRFLRGVPASVRPIVLSWMTPEMAAARGLSSALGAKPGRSELLPVVLASLRRVAPQQEIGNPQTPGLEHAASLPASWDVRPRSRRTIRSVL